MEDMMSSKRIKRTESRASQESIADEDIISDLPRNVIDCILGKMPIREAIRTSVLSKKWRFYHLTIPQLVFDEQFCIELKCFTAKNPKRILSSDSELGEILNKISFSDWVPYLFKEIVTKSLMLHPGRIEKFEVCIPASKSTRIPNVNLWLLYLSQRNIKKLTLEYMKDSERPMLPSCFFSCLDLTYLKLRNVNFLPLPEFKGFLHLEHLTLLGVHLRNNCLESILSSCPVLKSLVLHGCSGVRHFKISGSKLKKLCFKTNNTCEYISLENAPNLTEFSVRGDKGVKMGLESNPTTELVKFVGSLPKVKILHLNGKFLKNLAEPPVPRMLSASLLSLKIIELENVNFMDFDQISAVVCLIRSSWNLQELHIEASAIEIDQDEDSGYLKLLDCNNFPLSNLHQVKLTNFSGFYPEIDFIKFLLFNSPSLVKMSIVEHPDLEAEEALDITRQLLQLQPASAVSIDFLRESET